MQPVLIIVRGVSGSGKSTFAEWLLDNLDRGDSLGSNRLEADQWFVDNDEPWNPSYLRTAHEWCQAEVKKSLQAGCNTIVSNTTTTKKELDPYVKIATDLGVQYFVLISDSDYNNVHGVEDDKLRKQAQRFYFNNSVMQDNN
jgi:predicted kinase